jgi:hypothetical protein
MNEHVIKLFTVVELYFVCDTQSVIIYKICISQNKTMYYLEHRLMSFILTYIYIYIYIYIWYIILHFNETWCFGKVNFIVLSPHDNIL